ncbi:MAG: hypothetical protein HYX75_10670 [Acidobacteria bacterium]|nr:hypothetical protein [Acidobacteriota bacterium]
MVRIVVDAVTDSLSEVPDRVARGEHVRVELRDGRGFVAVPLDEDDRVHDEDSDGALYTPEEWAAVRERLAALRGKWAAIKATSDDLIRERRADVEHEPQKWGI